MKRAKPMRRTGFLKRGKRLAPVSKKTRRERWPSLRAVRTRVMARTTMASVGHCEFTRGGPYHPPPLDCHHVVKRSQGGPNTPSNLVRLCRTCHSRTDWPFAAGRLVIKALGRELFDMRIVYAKDKWAARA